MRKGLTKEKIIEAAIQLIEEKGYKNLSVKDLADKLGIKASSLYNHIDNVEDITRTIGLTGLQELVHVQQEAIVGKKRQDALLALAMAFRELALTKPSSYKIIMGLPEIGTTEMRNMQPAICSAIYEVINQYNISTEQKYHWQRILRSTMHGFISYELTGWYLRHLPIDNTETYRMAILNIAAALESIEQDRQSRAEIIQSSNP